MNCANHPNVAAIAYCRTCGKALCGNCTRNVRGVIYCEQCIAERLGEVQPPPAAVPPGMQPGVSVPQDRLPSPGLAAVLGFIPGVGAMYNGQFMKGFIHVMVFVCLIWMADHFGPIMVPVFFAYFFYLVFDAYKTAHAIELGQPLPDPFGLERMFGPDAVARRPYPSARAAGVVPDAAPANPDAQNSGVPIPEYVATEQRAPRAPTGAIILIVLGVLFLFNSLGFLEFGWVHRFWPVILIVLGGWLFVQRWNR
jgi:TM2 domain-containing membrane protein YozV